MVLRRTRNLPVFHVCPQMWVKPRKLNVSGFPSNGFQLEGQRTSGSSDYTALLIEHGMRISMSRRGNPYDDALAESFIKTLKYEEVYRQEYRDLPEARASIPRFLEQVYNQKRLHDALGYLPPTEFEKALENFAIGRTQKGALRLLELPGSGKSGRSQVGSSTMSFPAGYSLVGCAPAEPASASPAEAHAQVAGIGSTIVFARFSAFEVNFVTGELRKHGVRLKVQEQPFQVLVLLLAHPGFLRVCWTDG
jgi:hypothetical protein